MSPLIPPQAPQLHVPYDKRAASQDSPRTHLGSFAFTYATFSFWRNPGSAAPSNTINRRFLYIRFYNYSGRARISSLEATVTLVPLSVISTCPTRLWVIDRCDAHALTPSPESQRALRAEPWGVPPETSLRSHRDVTRPQQKILKPLIKI